MKKAVLLLLLRIAVCIYGMVLVFGLLNYVSMGIEAGHWPQTGLKDKLTTATVIGMLISTGSILSFMGLFNRLGAVLLLAGLTVLAGYFPYPAVLSYLPFVALTLVIVVFGNGSISMDNAIGLGENKKAPH